MPDEQLQKYPIAVAGPGVIKSLPPYLLPKEAFQDVKNARFLNGVLSKVPGWTKFDAQQLAGTDIMAIDQFFLTTGSDFLMVITLTTMYKWDTTNNEFDSLNGTAFTGDRDALFSTETAFDLFLATNGVDTLKQWDGAAATFTALGGMTTAEPLDGTPPIIITAVKCVRFFKNFVVIFNFKENGTAKPFRARWCVISTPGTWINAAGVGQAGAADVGTVDWIVTAERLGDTLAIYKERSIWLMSYVGLPDIFNFRERISGLGILGQKAIANFGDEHLFVGNDDIYFFNGESIEPVGDPIRRYLFDNMNPLYSARTTIFVAEEENEAIIAFASTASSGNFDKCLVYNYLEKTWSIREIAASAFGYYRRSEDLAWEDDSGSWDNSIYPGTWDERNYLDNSPINLIGDASGYVHQLTGLTKDGAALELVVTSKLHDFGYSDVFKRLWRLQLLVKRGGNYTMTVEVGTSENIDDDPVWTTISSFNLSTGKPFIDVDIAARFFTFRFTLGGTQQDVGLAGYIPYFTMEGER